MLLGQWHIVSLQSWQYNPGEIFLKISWWYNKLLCFLSYIQSSWYSGKNNLSQKTQLLLLTWRDKNLENLQHLTLGRFRRERRKSQSSDKEEGENVLPVPGVANNGDAFSVCLEHKHANPAKSKVPPEITQETTAAEGSVPRVCKTFRWYFGSPLRSPSMLNFTEMKELRICELTVSFHQCV